MIFSLLAPQLCVNNLTIMFTLCDKINAPIKMSKVEGLLTFTIMEASSCSAFMGLILALPQNPLLLQ